MSELTYKEEIERQYFVDECKMSRSFVDWFFDNKREEYQHCLLVAIGFMWEGWKARINQRMTALTI